MPEREIAKRHPSGRASTSHSEADWLVVYLLDTNVVSELRKPKPHQGVVAWVQDASDEALHLSAVTIEEIQAGIEITREQDVEKAREIETWLDH
jgi:toxin FitB